MSKDSDVTTRYLVKQPVLRKGKEEKICFVRITLSEDDSYVEYTCGWGWQPEGEFKPVHTNPPDALDICTWSAQDGSVQYTLGALIKELE